MGYLGVDSYSGSTATISVTGSASSLTVTDGYYSLHK
jgi:hypothetical protein